MRRLTIELRQDGTPFDGGAFTSVAVLDSSFRCTSNCSADFAIGSSLVLELDSIGPGVPIPEYVVQDWTGPCTPAGNRCRLTLDADATIAVDVEHHPHLIVHVLYTRESAGRGSLAADRHGDMLYYDPAQIPLDERAGFALEVGERVTITPLPAPDSQVGAWTGACASAGTGPCTIVADAPGFAIATIRFDPNVDPQYRLTGLVPLDGGTAMRGGKVVGAADGFAARYDIGSGVVTKLLANAMGKAVNRRGDVAGTTLDHHPFVAYANGAVVELTDIDGDGVALSEAGVLLGTARNSPSADRPTFTFDGQSVAWLDAPNFSGRTIDDVAGIGGCIQTAYLPTGGLFRNGLLSNASAEACVEVLNANGLAVGTRRGTPDWWRGVLWDGTSHDLPLVEAGDVDDEGWIAGAVDFDGYWPASLAPPGSYVLGLHAAVYSNAAAQDLNYVTDKSGVDALAHVPIERALALDGERILVTFRDRPDVGVLERVKQ